MSDFWFIVVIDLSIQKCQYVQDRQSNEINAMTVIFRLLLETEGSRCIGRLFNTDITESNDNR